MRSRVPAANRASVRPAWNWAGWAPSTALGWVALALVALHVALLAVMQVLHLAYWTASEVWGDQHVVAAATVHAVSSVAAGGLALFATLRRGEHSALMLVPVLLGAFWAFWLVAGLPSWLS